MQGKVGIAHQDAGRLAIRRIANDTDTGADFQVVVADAEFAGHGLQHGLAHLLCLVDRRIFKQDHELVAAEAGHESRLRQARVNALGDGNQQQIAVLVPQCVVHILEMIQIQLQHGAGRIRPGARHRQIERVIERRAVGQTGQVVVGEHVPHLRNGRRTASA